jgi:hypothetical protein
MRSWLHRVRSLPVRTRWLITLVGYALVIVAIVLGVRSVNSGAGSGGSSGSEATAVAEANREGRIAITEDEAPHSSSLASGVAPQVALEHAIGADVRQRIAHGQLTGPLQSVSCEVSEPAHPAHASGRQLTCTVRSAGLSYPFVGVADARTRELTWCKVDPPPVATAPLEVPVSPRCRA